MHCQRYFLRSVLAVFASIATVTAVSFFKGFTIGSNAVQTREKNIVAGYLKLRAGLPEDNAVIWHYTGVLRNPLSGAEIVGVEGLEFNRRLSDGEVHEEEFRKKEKKIVNGTTEILLKRKNDKNPSSTFISKKVFIYTDLSNRTEAITAFRSGKFAPKRPVSSVKFMNELITIGTKTKNIKPIKIQKNDKNKAISSTNNADLENSADKKVEKQARKRKVESNTNSNIKPNANAKFGNYFAEIEWPGGRKTVTDKILITKESGGQFSIIDILFGDFNDRSDLGAQYNVINFMRGKPKKPFNKWISFASPPDKISSGRSQEYYTVKREKIVFQPLLFLSDISQVGLMKLKKFQGENGNINMEKLKSEFSSKLKNILPKGKKVLQVDKSNLQENEVKNENGKVKEENQIITSVDEENSNSINIRPIINRAVANMKYKRYGECPSWYSVGKPTASEITGVRYNSINHIPKSTIKLININCPNFLIESDCKFLLEDYKNQKDSLENYRPWYSKISKIFR